MRKREKILVRTFFRDHSGRFFLLLKLFCSPTATVQYHTELRESVSGQNLAAKI